MQRLPSLQVVLYNKDHVFMPCLCCAADKLERLRNTQPAPQAKEKHEQEVEKATMVLQHKHEKLNRKCTPINRFWSPIHLGFGRDNCPAPRFAT